MIQFVSDNLKKYIISTMICHHLMPDHLFYEIYFKEIIKNFIV